MHCTRNLGREIFQHRSCAVGVGSIGQNHVGFGTAFVDFDQDGWEDLIIVNGHVIRYPVAGSTFKQRPVLLHNMERNSRRVFEDIWYRGGSFFSVPQLGRGLAVGDLDNDGWPDLVVSHSDSPVALLRNVASETIPHRWIGLQLTGKDRRCVVGTTVKLQVGTRSLTRFVKNGGSYLSNFDSRLLVGLGAAAGPITVTVRWGVGKDRNLDRLAGQGLLGTPRGIGRTASPSHRSCIAEMNPFHPNICGLRHIDGPEYD